MGGRLQSFKLLCRIRSEFGWFRDIKESFDSGEKLPYNYLVLTNRGDVMSKDISLNFEAINSAAAKLDTAINNSLTENDAVGKLLSELRSQFSGHTAEAFETRIGQWRTNSKDLLNALTSLKEFLTAAAKAISETDSAIANKLTGQQ